MRQLVSRHDLYHTIVLWQVCIVSTLEYCVEACNTDTENGHNKIMYIVHNRTTKINKNKFEMETLIKIDHHTLIFFIYILCLLLNIILKHFVENVLFLHDFVTFYLKFNMATTAWQQSDSCQMGTEPSNECRQGTYSIHNCHAIYHTNHSPYFRWEH